MHLNKKLDDIDYGINNFLESRKKSTDPDKSRRIINNNNKANKNQINKSDKI